MTDISPLTMLLKKSIHMTMTVPIVMSHVLQVLIESYVTIETVNIDSCSEFNDFLKALCTLSLFIVINYCNSICLPR